MAKVTSKLQVTIPKPVADAHGIRPGAEVSFESAGDVLHIHVVGDGDGSSDHLEERLASFDRASARQAERNGWFLEHHGDLIEVADRGWHPWAYAEFFGLRVLYSEDFQHERTYGTVRVVNPFLPAA